MATLPRSLDTLPRRRLKSGDTQWHQPPNPYGNGSTQWHQPPNPNGNGNTQWHQPPQPPPVTGGNLPAQQVVTQVTGGTLPAQVVPTVPAGPVTGGTLPAQVGAVPPMVADEQRPVTTPGAAQTSTVGDLSQQAYTPVGDEATISQNYLDQILSRDSALMRNARLRGIEAASDAGLQNSSIAAGASQRAALDVAMPLVQQSVDMFNQRENRQWQSEEEARQRDWTSTQNQLDRDQQITMAEVTNWLNNESFNREFNAQLALFPIQNTTQLLNFITEQAAANPEVYTPDIISGMSEFFTTNFLDVLRRYFPNMYTATGPGGT